ncbi:unnamed protein product [Danaus chrysippus]|uniref:(African queen) hypothetical protein n=1 Tax=Danaus chrysippus TaxID=151541 RepID=A0A8J2VYQ3_9NEOP|nr:unnamed protein product [Danaus chrysippus]
MSEGSVSTTSSRIKQFGLYRTIDARTEEFLRLSRKRQIKQGCACAAVSTAITVTIVVGVILIYEYGIVSEFSPNSIVKPNWLGLMNTNETIPFETKFNKSSINLDSSMRILPLILKALNKNIYYDKIMEDDTGDLYDKKEENQNIFTNNIFSDDRIQIPESRIYTIEYKTSPIVYYKNPTRNTDYFTKTRRIKDYQRIMNYVNKMINERITAASTVAMLKNSYAFDKNIPITTVTDIKRFDTKISQKKVKSINTNSDKNKKCTCSQKMNQLLSNVITLLQKLLPNSTHDILRKSKMCDERNKLSIKHDSVNKHIKDDSNTRSVLGSQIHLNKKNPDISKTSPTKVEEPNILMQSLFPKVKHGLKSLIHLILSNKFPDKSEIAINYNKHKSAMKKQSMAGTENYYVLSDEATDSLTINKNHSNISSGAIKVNKSNQTFSGDLIIATDISTEKNDKSFSSYIKVEDPTLTSPASNMINNFPDLDIHAMELVKSKLIPGRKNTHYAYDKSGKNKEIKTIHDSAKDENNNRTKTLWNLRKMGEIKKTDLETDMNVENYDENNYSSMRKMGNLVVLLIYEYMIVVETNLVQIKRRIHSNHNNTDHPVADKLDRSNFGFDQDYYERMPLLVNGLQESSYIEPTVELPVAALKSDRKAKIIYIRPTAARRVNKFNENKFIRRTSPRPFDFEYRSPYPQPFAKANGNPKNWVERYRNAERLRNLQDVIKYLEKTLNAKFGDMYLPSKAQIAFSGVFMSPTNSEDVTKPLSGDLKPSSSMDIEVRSNHKSDPLYIYRPDNPGDVNLLADGFKFSPTIFTTLNRKNSLNLPPKSLSDPPKKCFGIECNKGYRNGDKNVYLQNAEESKINAVKSGNEPKSFSVMLNLMPLPTTDSTYTKNNNEKEKIYLTTPKPWFYFKRKTIFPVRRTFLRGERPKYVTVKQGNYYEPVSNRNENIPKVTVKFNIFSTPTDKNTSNNQDDLDKFPLSRITSTEPSVTEYTNDGELLNSSHVEDYHVGSSGIIPIEIRPTLVTYPINTPITPLTSPVPSTETVFTNAPEIFKFSPEDARVPDHYQNIQNSDSIDYDESRDVQTESNNVGLSEVENKNIERQTLAIKLKNVVESTTESQTTEDNNYDSETTTEYEIETTTGTYVPMINGHYRNMKRKMLTTILQENSERYRRKRLENLLTIPKSTYVPMYDLRRIQENPNNE